LRRCYRNTFVPRIVAAAIIASLNPFQDQPIWDTPIKGQKTMPATPRLRRSTAYVCLGTISILFFCSRESFGATIRYQDSSITRFFNVTPSSGAKEILEFLVQQSKFVAVPNPHGNDPGEIEAYLDTANLKRTVSGLPVESITPYKLAQYAGYHTFNWRQHITSYSGSLEAHEINGNSDTVVAKNLLDPILNWSDTSHYYEFRNKATGALVSKIGILPDDLDLLVDGKPPYFTIAGMQLRNTASLEPFLPFHDRPVGAYLNGSATFKTELVGVNASNDVIASWSNIKVNFTWTANSVGVGPIGYLGVGAESGGPPIISGGVSNVELIAGDYNDDGRVDAADYTVWRNGLGSVFTRADYDVWRNNYGIGVPDSGSGAISNFAIPEPASALMLLVGMLSMGSCRRWIVR
jgi:hypothetical protein